MSAKVITEACLKNNGEYEKVVKLAETIKKRHTIINTETELIKNDKKSITGISTDMFFDDMGAEVPEVNGNHEYHTDDGIVRVNFKVKSTDMNTINDKDAKTVLTSIFGDSYGSLFNESDRNVLKASQKDLFKQAGSTPELFRIKLKDGLSTSDLAKLVTSFPDMLEVGVKDLNRYTEEYPESIDTNTTVNIQKDFLKKLAKVDTPILAKAKKFLKTFLKTRITPAVIVGNRSK